MATPVGVDVVSSISRRYIIPEIIDQFYQSNALFYRLDRSGKRTHRGGTQIELPLQVSDITAAGVYQGFEQLDTTSSDTVKNVAWDWKQYFVSVTIDGLTLIKNDSADAIANIVRQQLEQAGQKMEDQLGADLFSDATSNAKRIDGLQGAVDNGTVAATYAGLGARTTTNSFWQPAAGALDTTTATLTLAAMQTVFGAATSGSRHPTLLLGTQAIYNRYWNLNQVVQRFPTGPMGQDEQLAQAGFTNLLFNNVPLVVDSHCNANHLYFLNETYIEAIVSSRRDMEMTDFKQPTDQDAMTAQLLWAGNLIVKNVQRQGLMSAITN